MFFRSSLHISSTWQAQNQREFRSNRWILPYSPLRFRSAEGRSLLETLEVILDPKSWAHLHSGLASAAKAVLVGSIAQREWVEKLVTILEALIAASVSREERIFLVLAERMFALDYSFRRRNTQVSPTSFNFSPHHSP